MRIFPLAVLFFLWLLPFVCIGQTFGKKLQSDRLQVSFEVSKVPDLNTKASEFSPYLYKDRMIFTSNRESDYLHYGMNRWKRDAHLSLFWVELGSLLDSGKFKKARRVSAKINTREHTGPLCFSNTLDTAYFTRVSGNGDLEVKKPTLYRASYENGQWQNIKRLSFTNPQHSFAHPTITPNGQVLFYTSDKEGKGGKDIFYSVWNGADWTEPINLGEPVNTEGDEMFPLYQDSTLFFASTGQDSSFGNLDIYAARRLKGSQFGEPINLGPSMNSSADDFGLIFTENMKKGYLSSDRETAKGSDDIFEFRVVEKVIVEKPGIEGRFKYRELDQGVPQGLTVQAVDNSGEVVATTQTEEGGTFSFKELPANKAYTLKVVDDQGKELKLTIYTENDRKVFLLSDEKGEFVYRELGGDQTGTLSLIAEEDMNLEKNTGTLSGQFVYEQLPSDNPSGLTVKLVNDKGEVVYETTTDDQGNFQFTNLPLDKNLTLKAATNKDLTAYIYNRKGNVKARLKPNDKGKFVYRRLAADTTGEGLTLMDSVDLSDPVKDPPETQKVLGRFNYDDLGADRPEELYVVALSQNGDPFLKTRVGPDGYFRLSNLPPNDSIRFRAIAQDRSLLAELEVSMFNRKGQVVTVLDLDKKGYFIYKPLQNERKKLTKIEGEGEDLDMVIEKGQTTKIYYDYDSSHLRPKSAETLRQIVKKMKENPELKLEIHSYTDSRASKSYNLTLSKKRTQGVIEYLKREGIDGNRLSGEGHGETNLVNECTDGVECPEEKHQLNRRTEFKFIQD